MIVSFVGLGMFLFLCRRLYFVKCKSVFMCGTEEKIEKTRSRFWQFFFFKSCQLLSSYIAHIAVDKMND